MTTPNDTSAPPLPPPPDQHDITVKTLLFTDDEVWLVRRRAWPWFWRSVDRDPEDAAARVAWFLLRPGGVYGGFDPEKAFRETGSTFTIEAPFGVFRVTRVDVRRRRAFVERAKRTRGGAF